MLFIKIVIFIHLICATVWAGGHLILSIGFLPPAIKKQDFTIIESFESRYERIGIPSLLLLLITGIILSFHYCPQFLEFALNDHYTRHIFIKFILLILTIILAVHARFYLIPKRNINTLSWHILLVTLIALLFVFTGFSARSGGLI
ncbi:MAG: CopD family protein [Bacteroidia bacterium]|nr:CopD family protein [Bacteroidia bacterium]NNF82816.1 copper resistance protein CopD [Flavobacteriaceae bacterium]NNL80135.1 copper resistance protein CopD [Flavobacteriaceae bacterium]